MVEGTFTDVVEDSDRFTAPPEQAEQKGHWCAEHQVVFFKRGKMRQYAHPIGDTGQWCNEGEAPNQEGQAKADSANPSSGSPAKGSPKPNAVAGSQEASLIPFDDDEPLEDTTIHYPEPSRPFMDWVRGQWPNNTAITEESIVKILGILTIDTLLPGNYRWAADTLLKRAQERAKGS